jgi:hypothetical protein
MASSAASIINAFGGTKALAELTGVNSGAVRMWRINGIPYRVWPTLIREAERRGIPDITPDTLLAAKQAKAEAA